MLSSWVLSLSVPVNFPWTWCLKRHSCDPRPFIRETVPPELAARGSGKLQSSFNSSLCFWLLLGPRGCSSRTDAVALRLPCSAGAHARLIYLLRSAPNFPPVLESGFRFAVASHRPAFSFVLWLLFLWGLHSPGISEESDHSGFRCSACALFCWPCSVLCGFSSKHPGSPPPTPSSQWALRVPWQLQGRGALGGGVTGRHLAPWQHTEDDPSTLSSGGLSLGLVRLPFFYLERRPQCWSLRPEWLGDINRLAVGRPRCCICLKVPLRADSRGGG